VNMEDSLVVVGEVRARAHWSAGLLELERFSSDALAPRDDSAV
jgi:hypothetical protein